MACRRYNTIASSSRGTSARRMPPSKKFGRAEDQRWLSSLPPDQTEETYDGGEVTSHAGIPAVFRLDKRAEKRARKTENSPKIHILGKDETSKFIAHALSSVYESVEMIGWSKSHSSLKKFPMIELKGRRTHDPPIIVPNNILRREKHRVERPKADTYGPELNTAEPDSEEPYSVEPYRTERHMSIRPPEHEDSHIEQLIVTGQGHEASLALKSIKHRVDANTTICLANEGLGVMEHAQKKIFRDPGSQPDFLLGYLSHKLTYYKRSQSVKQLKDGVFRVTEPIPTIAPKVIEARTVENRANFIRALEGVPILNFRMAEYDEWLRLKLPSMISGSVVDVVSILLELPYNDLLRNRPARHMMWNLLDEITLLLQNMPEVKGSTAVRDLIYGQRMWQILMQVLMTKKLDSHNALAQRIDSGLSGDISYMNGYFVRRGKELKLEMPHNANARDMLLAKKEKIAAEINGDIAFEDGFLPY